MTPRTRPPTTDAKAIATALDKRTSLRESLGSGLQMLLERTDEALGIGAVLLNDPQLAQSILTSANQQAQLGLLAAARLTQSPLRVELVGKLLPGKNALLTLAAKRYLLAEDSKEARNLLWQHHPNQAFVTGWRENVEFGEGDYIAGLTKAEENLRAELFKEEAPLEIFALLANSERHRHVLRIYANKAIYTHYEDTARYRERVVSTAEVEAFKQFVRTAGYQDLGPQFGYCHHNCMAMEFVALEKKEPWRVLSFQGPEIWSAVAAKFALLGRGDGAKIHYELEKQIKGLEVLYADETLLVKDVWQRGDEIRIFVEREETEEEAKAQFSSGYDDEEDNEAAYDERRRKQIARIKARFSWRRFTGNKAGAVVAQPDVYTTFDESNFTINGSLSPRDRRVGMVNGNTIVAALNSDGLWKEVAGTKAVRIGEDRGAYADLVVTPDGKWVVVAKTDTDWSKPNYIVRFNVQTGQEFRVKLEPAEELNPIAFLPVHDRVLLRRAKREYHLSGNRLAVDPPEYYLLNAATGETQKVSGEFAPLHQEGPRFVQPSSKPHEFWAAIPDREKDQTQVGRYNLKTFSFTPVLTVPQIYFDSMSMWVDENRNKLYFVYNNQLLSLPLKSAVDSPR